ncbi:MAG: hypothetical protein OEW29_06325, partial [Acidimicrobiia bacterium]|nr:hypothetical protein [Acidimicrobiia bacterium]
AAAAAATATVSTRALPAVGSMLALAVLDLIGAVLARHWADHRALVSLVGGMAVFALLFVVYGRSLDYAELSTVTIGWVAFLQIGVVLLDRFDGGVAIPPHKLIAMGAIMVAQCVLTLG